MYQHWWAPVRIDLVRRSPGSDSVPVLELPKSQSPGKGHRHSSLSPSGRSGRRNCCPTDRCSGLESRSWVMQSRLGRMILMQPMIHDSQWWSINCGKTDKTDSVGWVATAVDGNCSNWARVPVIAYQRIQGRTKHRLIAEATPRHSAKREGRGQSGFAH
jgi:hypothetical protein